MVTILGGGIAGTVLGGALAHREHPVTVYERQPAPGAGAFMVLDGYAQQALTELGVPTEPLEAVSHPMPGGFGFHYLPAGRNAAPSRGHRLYPRGDLMRVLTEFAASAGTDIRYGHTATDIDTDTGTLWGTDGVLAADELIIAADGIDSLARARLEPARTAAYAGQVVIYGTTTRPVPLNDDPTVMHFHGTLGDGPLPVASFGHLRTDNTAYWFTRVTRDPISVDDIGAHPVDAWADTIHAADPSAAGLIGALLEATDTVHVANCRNVPLHNARRPAGRVLLCGDADHAVSPAAARGAREAIEDALALTTALTTGTSPAEAMAARRIELTAEREKQARIYATAMPQPTERSDDDEEPDGTE
ncbi:FAD-dependent oxidoreductase [Nocardia mexicana]|uniref:2-polyprenyl-6-methoxyphenol hydroxylase-like FAD-dependent oxidoreductase n=1 Tax=Nocardia mexicana TaxID=279262 RepID=A0A370HCA3_9NOCA|nr:NAD(P)/FAD-dependent oxidoreductase [Nocardia mexicana]RDI54121.1 2-polyprenyl-6-methoxyphenol hydroxylase-like FAD-dependent oxidoreductase [Nocardia mexicana]